MNRHDRRRAAALAAAMDALRHAPDTASGATIMLADGTTSYVSRATAEAMAPPSAPTPNHAESLRAIHGEAAGVMTLDVVLRADMPGLVEAAALGNPEAAALHQRVLVALGGIMNAPADEPKLCAACPRPLGDGRFSLALVTPACDDPRNALALAVCHDCADTREAVRVKAMRSLRRIWPDARPFTVTHPDGGHA